MTGAWVIARTPISWPYPCACLLDDHWQGPTLPARFCNCRGRRDGANLTAQCCAVRAGETTAAARCRLTASRRHLEIGQPATSVDQLHGASATSVDQLHGASA